eukprot:TRINITY_DN33047_c0_g1_i2.p1 TRINITY_DN33047_c0_g1~~TRINITY_DN33047_c0_g1_i2.p1  ORF type:complete len:273 (+),score=31.85 TRINITY_DN33047_c0_g1_i2:111-821(+)
MPQVLDWRFPPFRSSYPGDCVGEGYRGPPQRRASLPFDADMGPRAARPSSCLSPPTYTASRLARRVSTSAISTCPSPRIDCRGVASPRDVANQSAACLPSAAYPQFASRLSSANGPHVIATSPPIRSSAIPLQEARCSHRSPRTSSPAPSPSGSPASSASRTSVTDRFGFPHIGSADELLPQLSRVRRGRSSGKKVLVKVRDSPPRQSPDGRLLLRSHWRQVETEARILYQCRQPH